jgi:D-glycero-D-manno-heptose 1,7-bisphosphate phosphatase
MNKKKAVFLDRDGVITEDPPHYAHRVDQVRIIPGSCEAIRLLNMSGFQVIVVSNQSGVAKGYYKEHDIGLFNEEMKRQLSLEGAYLDAEYYCPHHPDGVVKEYCTACTCRKPQPGMLIRAAKQHRIDLNTSFMVGDKFSDIVAGKSVNCRTIFVLTGHGKDEVSFLEGSTVPVAVNLLNAVKEYII